MVGGIRMPLNPMNVLIPLYCNISTLWNLDKLTVFKCLDSGIFNRKEGPELLHQSTIGSNLSQESLNIRKGGLKWNELDNHISPLLQDHGTHTHVLIIQCGGSSFGIVSLNFNYKWNRSWVLYLKTCKTICWNGQTHSRENFGFTWYQV